MAGLTSLGLEVKRFPEILEDLAASEKTNIDSNISTQSNELLGQINNILSLITTEIWELAEAVNSNFDKDKAEGTNLDELGSLIGVTRLEAVNTQGDIIATTKDGVIFSEGSIVASFTTGDRFDVYVDTICSTTLCTATTLNVAQVLNSTLYTVTINDIDYDFTSDASATESEILSGIKNLIDLDATATWSATVVGSDLTITTTDEFEISLSSVAYFTVTSVDKTILVVAQEGGLLSVPANTVTVLVSSISDVTSINNVSALTVGRLVEDDEDFRLRFGLSSGANGKSTIPAIRAQVSSVSGVSTVAIFDNDTTVTDGEGLPPHSFEVIVLGGADSEIAEEIWNNKPAGIQTYGTTSTIIVDEVGDQRTIKYTRPSIINMAVRATYTVYDEEDYPDNGDDLMADAILAHVNSLVAGVDVIPTRMFGDIYTDVSGVDSLVIDIQVLTNPGDTPSVPSWSTTKQSISVREYAQTTLTDISIVAS